jgi:hypothetical protein
MRRRAYAACRVNHVSLDPLLQGRDGMAGTVGTASGK